MTTIDITALTSEQAAALDGIVQTVRTAQTTGSLSHEGLRKVFTEQSKTLTDEVLATAHALLWSEYEKDQTLGLFRAVLSPLHLEHYWRFLALHQETATADLFALWEADTADETMDPVRLERTPAEVYCRILGDRVLEKYGHAGHDHLEKIIDDFPEAEGHEELPARFARYKAHEIAALRALLAD